MTGLFSFLRGYFSGEGEDYDSESPFITAGLTF